MIRSWNEIHAYYADHPVVERSLQGMLKLVREINSSRYKDGLFAWTSANDLCIAQIPVSYPYNGPYLRISPIADGLLEFRYIDTPVEDKQWRRIVDGQDGFVRLERFLHQLHWFCVEQ